MWILFLCFAGPEAAVPVTQTYILEADTVRIGWF
jgi:hypothetical protein